ncbi:ComF family protein [Defluviitalea saccharophila]|uniref:ComF family protein n=1 Tax=Defluviitalea saccharophila TaxID=879970 RepID=A0ABZ2Y449_9FIRM
MWVDLLLDLVYPPRCIFCTSIIPIQEERGICKACKSALPFVEGKVCEKCGKPIQDSKERTTCFDCVKNTPVYDRGWAVFIYEGMVKEAIYRFKYGGHKEYAKYLGKFMADKIKDQVLEEGFDLIIPIPIHKNRKRKRGYNQAEELAKEISKALNIPMDASILTRVKETRPQSGLSIMQRQNNLKKAFKLADSINLDQMKILLVDDIYTTGTTINYCTTLLKKRGAKMVCFLSLSIGQDM